MTALYIPCINSSASYPLTGNLQVSENFNIHSSSKLLILLPEISIISSLLSAITALYGIIVVDGVFSTTGLITAIGIIVGAIILVAGVVFVQEAERRVPVQYA